MTTESFVCITLGAIVMGFKFGFLVGIGVWAIAIGLKSVEL